MKSVIKCVNCGNSFTASPSHVKRGTRYCSRNCYREHYSGKHVHNWKGGKTVDAVCRECRKNFKIWPYEVNANDRGFFCSRKCTYAGMNRSFYKNNGLKHRGSKSPVWKGNKVTRRSLHQWVEFHLGKTKKCDFCGTTEAKQYDWANKDHKYKRNLNDWIRLCRSCHSKFDYQNGRGALWKYQHSPIHPVRASR